MKANRGRVPLLALFVATFSPLLAPLAGQAPDDHAAHHPAPPAPTPSPVPAAQSLPDPAVVPVPGGTVSPVSPAAGGAGPAASGGMAGMEAMMRMATPAPEQLYPFLMRFPDLTAEARLEVEERAEREASAGLAALGPALEATRDAARAGDLGAAARAAVAAREALAQIERAQAVESALQAGRPPREAALAWFRREMSLLPPPSQPDPLSLSWRHLVGMSALAALALGLGGLFVLRVRRASRLLSRLAETERSGE